MGQAQQILNESVGEPMRDWIDNIPNDGIIRYLTYFNTEILFLTSPRALNEVLNDQVQNFVKTEHVRTLMSKMMGIGMILAEGEEHKVCNVSRCFNQQLTFPVYAKVFPTSLYIPPDQRSLPFFLEHVSGTS